MLWVAAAQCFTLSCKSPEASVSDSAKGYTLLIIAEDIKVDVLDGLIWFRPYQEVLYVSIDRTLHTGRVAIICISYVCCIGVLRVQAGSRALAVRLVGAQSPLLSRCEDL